MILIGAVALHRGSLALPFFADDYLFLEQVRGRSLVGALTAPDALGNFLRPVGRQLYFWLVAHLGDESPLVFHAANLCLFLGVIALLHAIVRRIAGDLAAAAAAAFLALHYAADVPLRWVSGSQDLLAVLGALAAIALHVAGRRVWAAIALFAALLAKEAVVPAALIAAVIDRRPGEAWRATLTRAWPLGLASAAWLALWLATAPQHHTLAASLGFEPLGSLAALVHLAHVAVGLEWRDRWTAVGSAWPPPALAFATVLVAIGIAHRQERGRGEGAAAFLAGGLWAIAATVPVIAVAAIWSAYYYLFALCGVAILVGALAARGPRWWALALVAALALGSQSGRAAPEFATGRGAWTWQSHINRRYIDRATERVALYLEALKAARPSVPPRSTLFVAGVPAFTAWQTADGPLVRWAYRDTSLRSYYQTEFTLERARRGPVYFFGIYNDTLREEPLSSEVLQSLALRVLLNERLDTARDLLRFHDLHEGPAVDADYFLAWLEWARGDTLEAVTLLRRAGCVPDRGPAREAVRQAASDTSGISPAALISLVLASRRHALDPDVHGALADAYLVRDPTDPRARIEALAARVLAPDSSRAWVRWGVIQANDGRASQAVRSLEHALALGIEDSVRVAMIRQALVELRTMIPGGALVQQELRR